MFNGKTRPQKSQVGPSWLREVPPDRQCQARLKRGAQCGFWTVKGKKVCWRHGGRSTGPKTQEGYERIQIANAKHGQYALNELKARLLVRFSAACYYRRECKSFQTYVFTCLRHMTYASFREVRPLISRFCRDRATVRDVAEALSGPQKEWLRLQGAYLTLPPSPEPASLRLVEEFLAGKRLTIREGQWVAV